MGLFSKKPTVDAHKAALKDLHDNQRAEKKAGIREETDTYLALNQRVHDTEQRVPWWRR